MSADPRKSMQDARRWLDDLSGSNVVILKSGLQALGQLPAGMSASGSSVSGRLGEKLWAVSYVLTAFHRGEQLSTLEGVDAYAPGAGDPVPRGDIDAQKFLLALEHLDLMPAGSEWKADDPQVLAEASAKAIAFNQKAFDAAPGIVYQAASWRDSTDDWTAAFLGGMSALAGGTSEVPAIGVNSTNPPPSSGDEEALPDNPVAAPGGDDGITVTAPAPLNDTVPDDLAGLSDRDNPGIPAGAELYKVGDAWWVVYAVPETVDDNGEPVLMAWNVESVDALERITGKKITSGEDMPTPNYTITDERFAERGILNMGITAEIVGTSEHPFLGMSRDWEDLVKTQPWLLDPEIASLMAESMIEGNFGEIPTHKLQATDWWRSRTEAQREWIGYLASDPAGAAQFRQDTSTAIRSQLIASGLVNPDDDLVNFLSNKRVTGEWSDVDVQAQVFKLGNPAANIETNEELASFLEGNTFDLSTTQEGENRVRTLARDWLGPQFGAWGDHKVSEWANKIRAGSETEDSLIDVLRGQRLTLFPGYTDPKRTYEDIAGPWRTVWAQTWGTSPDENDPLFTDIMRRNDLAYARQKLISTGLERGVGSVVNSVTDELGRAFGGNVRAAV